MIRSPDPNICITRDVDSAAGQCSSVGSDVVQVIIADPAVENAGSVDAAVKTVGSVVSAVGQYRFVGLKIAGVITSAVSTCSSVDPQVGKENTVDSAVLTFCYGDFQVGANTF